MLLCCSRGVDSYVSGVKEDEAGSGEVERSDHRELEHQLQLLWPEGLATRWKERVLYLHLSVLGCDVGEICVCLHLESFIFCMFLWKNHNRKRKMRKYRIILWTQSSDQWRNVSENDLGISSVCKMTYFAMETACSIPCILKFDSKPTKLCPDMVKRKVFKILCSDAHIQSRPVSS